MNPERLITDDVLFPKPMEPMSRWTLKVDEGAKSLRRASAKVGFFSRIHARFLSHIFTDVLIPLLSSQFNSYSLLVLKSSVAYRLRLARQSFFCGKAGSRRDPQIKPEYFMPKVNKLISSHKCQRCRHDRQKVN